MRRRSLAIGIVFLLMCSGFIPLSLGYNINELMIEQPSNFRSGNTLYVGGSGPNNYTKIQDAIDNASDGDTVFVYSGIYYENIVIDKSINLIGMDKNVTIIDGDFSGIPVKIESDNCLVSRFTIMNCASDFSLDFIYSNIQIINSENVNIKENKILNINSWSMAIDEGIYLNNSFNCTIQDNIIFDDDIRGQTSGIALNGGSSNNNITSNKIAGFNKGVHLFFYSKCRDNIIYDNHIYNNLFGIDIFGNSSYTSILKNLIEYNGYRGIRILDSQHNFIINNIIRFNGRGNNLDSGICLGDEGCRNNFISQNLILNNSKYGIVLKDTSGNTIINNNFINNEIFAYFDFRYSYILLNRNQWDGNYWNRTRLLPYIIIGKGYIFNIIPIIWFNIDWHPARKPYDI